MKHDCIHKYFNDDQEYHPFQEAFVNGYIIYDDFYDAYMIVMKTHERIQDKLLWLPYWLMARYQTRLDILKYCPFCGAKIYEAKP